MTDGETYKRTRLSLGYSRADLSAMAKRAGHTVSQASIERLEKTGSGLAGGRAISYSALSWIDYLLGISDPDGVVDWARVEQGAPVVVHGEKGAWQFQGTGDDGTIVVFGGCRNQERFRHFAAERVRLVALTALPPPECAGVFEHRYKGSDSVYAGKIMAHVRATPGAHSVGAMAWMLGMDNAIVSRVAADLAKRGELVKIQRGVFVLPEQVTQTPAPAEPASGPFPADEATSVKSALAERIGAPRLG